MNIQLRKKKIFKYIGVNNNDNDKMHNEIKFRICAAKKNYCIMKMQ